MGAPLNFPGAEALAFTIPTGTAQAVPSLEMAAQVVDSTFEAAAAIFILADEGFLHNGADTSLHHPRRSAMEKRFRRS
jgi:hypothetical protein